MSPAKRDWNIATVIVVLVIKRGYRLTEQVSKIDGYLSPGRELAAESRRSSSLAGPLLGSGSIPLWVITSQVVDIRIRRSSMKVT